MRHVEALYYEKLADGSVRCLLCPNLCLVKEGSSGRCRLRRNEKGMLIADSYGRTVTAAVDPIEKKPLYHFLPGSTILSIGPNGCTLTCDHCQNWNISQQDSPVSYIPPERLASMAKENSSIGVAFTYTEPLLWYEYLKDTLPLLRREGLRSVLVTNGYLNEEPAAELIGEVDAFNVDLKAFSDNFYRDYCGGRIDPVKKFIEIAAGMTHLEVTTLVIPGLNDSPGEIEAMCRWLASVSPSIPLHLSRFFPRYRMNGIEPTPGATLQKAYDIARRFLDYVYIGNIFIEGTENTFCPGCGEAVIKRTGYSVGMEGQDGACPRCGNILKGVWK